MNTNPPNQPPVYIPVYDIPENSFQYYYPNGQYNAPDFDNYPTVNLAEPVDHIPEPQQPPPQQQQAPPQNENMSPYEAITLMRKDLIIVFKACISPVLSTVTRILMSIAQELGNRLNQNQ